jgi:hypothetical protein
MKSDWKLSICFFLDVLKGLQRLRRQPDDIHKIASGFAVQGNISCPSTLAQRIARVIIIIH